MYPSPYAGSGAGGKIRRRPPPRAASTPYERPPAAAAAHRLAAAAAAAAAASASSEPAGERGGGSGGWVSRLVDPASRLIAGGAARLFGSVFRKRLAPPPAPSPPLSSPPGKNNEPKQDLPDSTHVDSLPIPEGGMEKGKSIVATSDDKALSEVEHLLMRKTFTKVEFDRLTDLLRARTIESDPPKSIVSREEKNEESIRIDGIGGSALRHMDLDDSPAVKGQNYSNDLNTSSLPQRAQSLHVGGRQVLKRSGAELENELGSIGPIRRIRQKSNMMSSFRDSRANPRGSLLTSHTSGSYFTEDSTSIQSSSSKRLLVGSSQSLRPLESEKNGGDGKSSDSIPPIPAQSNKMAEKIFEQLNIIAPSPKQQQSVTLNASNSMSKKPVLQDAGPSSMYKLYNQSSSLKFQDLDGANGPLDTNLNGSLLKKDKLNIIKDVPPKAAFSDRPTLLGNSVSASKSLTPGFKMAVIEDSPELDDDLEVPIPSSKIEVETTEQKIDSNRKEQKVEQNTLEQRVEPKLKKNIAGSPVSEQPVASLSKTVPSSGGLLLSNDPGKAVPNASVDNNTGFAFSNAPPGTRPATGVSAMPLASVKDDKQTGASNSIFGIKQSIASDSETSTIENKSTLGQSVTKLTTLASTSPERGDKTEKAEDVAKSSDKVLPSAASTTLNAPLHFTSAASTSSLSNGFSYSPPKLETAPPTDKPAISSAASTSIFAVSSSSPAISSSPAFTAFSFSSSAPVGSSVATSAKSDGTTAENKAASTISFGIGGAKDEVKSVAPDATSKPSSKLFTSPVSSSIASFSSSSITSTPSLSPVAASSDAAGIAMAAPSSTSTAPGLQSASTPSFTFPSSGNSLFGFSSPAQSTVLSTPSVAGSTSQPSSASTLFGSKPTQSEGTMQQPSQSSKPRSGSPFPAMTPGVGASSSGSGTLSFGLGASSTGSGTISFGVGSSSSAPGTSSAFGAAAHSSGPGVFSFGAGASSSGSGTVPFGVGAASSGLGVMSFGAGASSSGPGIVSSGAGASSSGPGTVSFGAGVSSGPGTVSFGATTSTSGAGFGNSPFGTGAMFANPFSSSSSTGFTFSSPSSSAGASTVASTSVFASTSTASSASAFSNPFGSSSSPPSTFTFGQSASSGSGFAFGAQPAPTFSSQPSSVFSFTSANTSMNSSPQLTFGMTNTNTAFGVASPGNDQMNEDSMADDISQAAPVPAPIFGSSSFGQQNISPAAPVFGAPAVQPAGGFQFGGQQGSAQQNPSFPAAGSLEFQGGNFSLGSGGGGGDKSNRRVIKVKRTTKKR
ncbi:unnamed protein product [Miscanthus lutarioriparius]|uniref:Nuclear pore complex protein NUP1 n=1 Tax=Miscanthus lutarioriparius TaxID=422564 RepID=A0A811SR71_9POAL|nr:unnamed protein product [Miscanthus lutarioriparius]